MIWNGEEPAWEELARQSPEDICKRACARFDSSSGEYTLRSFTENIFISPKSRRIAGKSPLARRIVDDLAYYSRLAVLYYLVNARDIPLSGELAKPYNMGAGQIYFSGTHKLPLDELARKFGHDADAFLKKGAALGGERLDYADASLRLLPFPRIPLTLVLWRGDDEFPQRADMLFDSTCPLHLPPDIVWSTAMMTLLTIIGDG